MRRIEKTARDHLPVAAFLVVLSLVPLAGGNFLIAIMIFAGMYTIMVMGLNLLTGYTGQVSFGHNAFVGIGAYTSAILTTKLGWSPWLGLATAMIVAAIVAYLVGYPALRLKGHSLVMATAALGLIAEVVFREFRALTNGTWGIGSLPALSIGSFEFDSNVKFYYLVWAIVFVLMIGCSRIVASRVGRAIRAIGGDEIAALAIGIDVTKYKVQLFMLSAVYAAIGGSLYSHFTSFISPEAVGLHLAILLICMLFVGGVRTIWGPLVGAIALALLPELLRGYKQYNQLIYAFLLILVLMFLSRGLSGETMPFLLKLRISWRRRLKVLGLSQG